MLASICDVMPLRKVNRILALNVIKDIEKQDVYLFKKILEFKKKNRPLEINDFAFLIGPIINSAGRIGNANKIVQLLTSNNNLIKNKIINEIIRTNEKRKKIEKYCFKEINLTKFKNSKDWSAHESSRSIPGMTVPRVSFVAVISRHNKHSNSSYESSG